MGSAKYMIILFNLILIGCNHSTMVEKRSYFNNGNIKEQYFLDSKNQRQGIFCVFYQNGKLSTKAKFKNDVQIDTTFHYSKKGRLEALAIFDKKGNTIKEMSFFSNGRVNVVRSFFVDGGGEIAATKTFFNDGQINEIESDFAKLIFYGKKKDSVHVKLYNCDFTDSIRVNIIQSFNFKYSFQSSVLRTVMFSNTKELKFNLLESDYINGKVNIQILAENWISSKLVKVNSYPIQLSKGTILNDNVEGIYRNY